MSNVSKQIIGLSVSFCLTMGVLTAHAKPKETVGNYLKRLSAPDRGAGTSSLNKSSESLPTSADMSKVQTRTPVDLSRVKPPSSSELMRSDKSDQGNLERVTDQQIQELYKLTQRFKTSPSRGELWLRLAELYVEKAQIIDYKKQTEYDAKLKLFHDGKLKQKPRLDTAAATDYNKKAIQLYEWFARDFPKDQKMDQALFFLGYNFFELGDSKKGNAYYTRLIKEHPRSTFVNETYFALAEYNFENDQWKLALDYYAKVLKNKNARLFNFALYKAAWCLFRLGDTKRALSFMEKLIYTSRQQAASKNVSRFKLEQEALRDVVIFYAESGSGQNATAYFKNLVGKDYRNYLDKLAYYWTDKGNRDAAYYVFTDLINDQPHAAKAFDYQYQIVVNSAHNGKSKQYRDELYKWVREYAPGSSWGKANAANSANQEFLNNATKLRETTLRNHVLQMHQTAQNARAEFSRQVAQEGYQVYMEAFPSSPQVADMRFFYGELLYDMKKYDEAATQYRWVADNAPTSKYGPKSTFNTVLSLEKGLPPEKEMQDKIGDSLEKVALDPRVDKFIKTGLWYLTKYPTGDKSVEIKFRIGRLYYLSNHLDEATSSFREVVQKYPTTKYAEYSANLLLDIYNLRKDYAGLEKTGNELLALPSIANSKAGQDIKGVLEKASFKKGQDLEIAKDYNGSALQYEAFAKHNPTSPLAVTALFNAAVNFERANQMFPAIAAHKNVIASNKKEAADFKPKSRRLIAKLYQDTGQYENAANMYAQVGAEAGKDPLAPNYFYNAAILYAGLAKNDLAIKNYNKYYELGKKSERNESIFEVAEIHRKQGQNSKAIEKYEEYLRGNSENKSRIIESNFRIYEISKKMGRIKDSEEWSGKTVRVQARLNPDLKGLGAQYASQIKFEKALVGFREFAGMKIPNDPAKQKSVADKKLSLLGSLNKELAGVIKYDSPDEIVGAITVVGQANANMAQSFLDVPLPAGLNPEEKKQYKEGIEKLVEPYKKTAKESFKKAVERGQELDVYNEYYRKSFNAMKMLEPETYRDGEEIVIESANVNWIGL